MLYVTHDLAVVGADRRPDRGHVRRADRRGGPGRRRPRASRATRTRAGCSHRFPTTRRRAGSSRWRASSPASASARRAARSRPAAAASRRTATTRCPPLRAGRPGPLRRAASSGGARPSCGSSAVTSRARRSRRAPRRCSRSRTCGRSTAAPRDGVVAAEDVSFVARARRMRRARRRVGQRQDDDRARDRRPAPAGGGSDPARRRARSRRRARGAASSSAGGCRSSSRTRATRSIPATPSAPRSRGRCACCAASRDAEADAEVDAAARPGAAAAARGRPLPGRAVRRRAPARRRSRGRWRPGPSCSSATRSRPRWTSPSRRRCSSCSAICATSSVSSMLFITHDLGVVATIADRVLVLEQGLICEEGPVGDGAGRATASLHAPAARVGAEPRRLLAALMSVLPEPGVISFARGIPSPEMLPVEPLAECSRRALARHGRTSRSTTALRRGSRRCASGSPRATASPPARVIVTPGLARRDEPARPPAARRPAPRARRGADLRPHAAPARRAGAEIATVAHDGRRPGPRRGSARSSRRAATRRSSTCCRPSTTRRAERSTRPQREQLADIAVEHDLFVDRGRPVRPAAARAASRSPSLHALLQRARRGRSRRSACRRSRSRSRPGFASATWCCRSAWCAAIAALATSLYVSPPLLAQAQLFEFLDAGPARPAPRAAVRASPAAAPRRAARGARQATARRRPPDAPGGRLLRVARPAGASTPRRSRGAGREPWAWRSCPAAGFFAAGGGERSARLSSATRPSTMCGRRGASRGADHNRPDQGLRRKARSWPGHRRPGGREDIVDHRGLGGVRATLARRSRASARARASARSPSSSVSRGNTRSNGPGRRRRRVHDQLRTRVEQLERVRPRLEPEIERRSAAPSASAATRGAAAIS